MGEDNKNFQNDYLNTPLFMGDSNELLRILGEGDERLLHDESTGQQLLWPGDSQTEAHYYNPLSPHLTSNHADQKTQQPQYTGMLSVNSNSTPEKKSLDQALEYGCTKEKDLESFDIRIKYDKVVKQTSIHNLSGNGLQI